MFFIISMMLISCLQVEPVTAGHRVTLTYELTAEKAAPAGQQQTMCVSEAAARGTPLFSVLESALQNADFFPRGRQDRMRTP